MGIIGIALPLWWVGKDWNPTVPHEFFQIRSRAATIPPTSAFASNADAMQQEMNSSLRTYLPAHEQFWKHYVTDGYSDYGPVDARHFQTVLDTMMPNLNTGWGQELASGYEPVPLSAPAGVDALGRVALRRGEPNLSRLLAIMGARSLILPQNDRISDPRFHAADVPAQSQHGKSVAGTPEPAQRNVRLPVNTSQNEDVLPRVWIARDIRHVEGQTRLSAALADPDFHPEQTAILQDAPDALASRMEWPEAQSAPDAMLKPTDTTCRVSFLDAHTMRVEADCGASPGFLMVSLTAFPGWQAQVDAKPAPIHRADGSIMGLTLPSGKHIVFLQYKPACYALGLYLSLLAVGTLTALTGYLQIQAWINAKTRP